MSLLRSTRLLATSRVSSVASASSVSGPAQVRRVSGGNVAPTSGPRDVAQEQKDRESNAVQASAVSDAPVELTQRAVRIFKPAKTAHSSGKAGTATWRVDFDILQGSGRWENPLMGWASSGDYMQGTSLRFKTAEDAIHFCTKQGWDYFVQQPHAPRIGPKSYAANYDYSPGKLRVHHTK